MMLMKATTMALMVALTGLLTIAGALEGGGWTKSADAALNVNQTSFSDSWEGAESGSITWTLKGDFLAEKALSPKFNWRNTLNLAFGETHQEYKDAEGDRRWASPMKSTDRIFLESVLRMTLGYFVDPFAAVSGESKFYDPADSISTDDGTLAKRVSRMFHPIMLTESIGLGRTLTKNKQTEFLSRLGFAVRQDMYKVVVFEPEQTTNESTVDGGLEWVTDFSHTFAEEKMKYVSKLRVFQAVFNSKEDELKTKALTDSELDPEAWKSADAAWENTFSANVSKYIQVSLFAELLYDKEVELHGRFREVLGLGVAYKLY